MGLYYPYVVEKDGASEKVKDIFTRLLEDRVIYLGTEINDDVANVIIGQLLFLASDNPSSDIHMYINSPGGVVSSGFGIFDVMNYIKPDVRTYCVGQAASMGAFLLAAGKKGKRFILPNSRVMIHQVSGGANGQASDVEIRYKEMIKYKEKLTRYLAEFSGKDYDKVYADCERDYYMSSSEALEYGLVDHIMIKNEG